MKGDGDPGPDGKSQANERDAAYEYSLDPDTRSAEKKLRRVVAKQVGTCMLGVGVGANQACLLLSCRLFMKFPCTHVWISSMTPPIPVLTTY